MYEIITEKQHSNERKLMNERTDKTLMVEWWKNNEWMNGKQMNKWLTKRMNE